MKPTALALSACTAALLWIPAWGQQPAAQTYTFEISKGAGRAELEVALDELGVDLQGISTGSIQLDGASGSFDGEGINVFQVKSAKQDGKAPAQGRGYLGISYEPVDGAMRIAALMPGSGAAEAGLRVDDRITRIGKFYYGNDDFESGVSALAAGDSVEVRAVRGDRVLEVQVELRTLAAVQGQVRIGQKLPVAPRAAEEEVRLRLTPAAPKAKGEAPVTGEWIFEADEEDCSCCPCCTECEKNKGKPAKTGLGKSPEPEVASPRVVLGRRLEQPKVGGGLAKVRILRKALEAPEQAAGTGGMQALAEELRLLRKEMAGLRKDLAVMRKTMAVQAKQASAGTPKAAEKKSSGAAKAKANAKAKATDKAKAKAKATKKKARTERKARASKRKKAKADRRTRQARARKRRARK